MPKSKILRTKKKVSSSSEDRAILTDAFLKNLWEIDILSNKNSFLDTDFWNILGYKTAAATEKIDSWFSIVHPEDLKTLQSRYLLLLKESGNATFCIVIRFYSHENETVWMELNGVIVKKGVNSTRVFGSAKNITEAKQKECVLEKKVQHYKNVIKGGNVAIWELNLVTGIVDVNQRYAEILGYGLNELEPLSKERWKSFVNPDDSEYLSQVLIKLLNEKGSFDAEFRFKHKEGHWVYVLSSGEVTEVDKEGNAKLISGFLFDISVRKKNEILLVDYANIIKRINAAAKIGLWEVNIYDNERGDETVAIWDDNTRKFIGVSKEFKPIFSSVLGVIKEGKYRDKYIKDVANAIENGIEYDIVLPIINQTDGKEKWARVIGIPEYENKQCIRLYGFFQDVDKETSNSKELAVKEEQLRHNFNQAAVGMALVNLDGNIDKVNKELSRIVGFTKNELLSSSFGHIAHPEDFKITQDILKSVLSRKQDSAKAEFRCIHKKGCIVWVSIVISAVNNDAGKLMHLFLQAQDISENKNLTESLKEHNNRLVNFAHIVSHNLRSHASNISMLLDLIFKDHPLIMENEYLKNIKIVSDNMNDTIYDLNEIVELSSDISSKLTAQNLLDCIRKSLQNIHTSIKESEATVEIDVDPSIKVLAINAYLESIILNLITNAVKYRTPNRPLKINISAEFSWDNVVLSIEDNGLGIDLKRYGDKLFGLYKVFHENKDAKGVGLFIVKNQVEAMGGKIEVTSAVKKGTKFTAYFKKA